MFPADDAVLAFFRREDRADDFVELLADDGAAYDLHEQIDPSAIEPLIARPSSPGNVVPVREVAGEGMGQAPATGRNSLRTMPRNFPERSGTKEDSVWLCSPETAAASALTGKITDPRDWVEGSGMSYPTLNLPSHASVNTAMLVAPLPGDEARKVQLVKGPNISSLPEFPPLLDRIEAPVMLKVGDNVSTDETYPERAAESADGTGHIVGGGDNYGQGSSREHAAITPRYLGLRAEIPVHHRLSSRQIGDVLADGVIPRLAREQ